MPWSIKAAEAGKHVLCEKPIALDVGEARELLAVRDRTGRRDRRGVHGALAPAVAAREGARPTSGAIGDLRLVTGTFSYFKRDPQNVRNMAEIGGGGLYDIGCYPITTSRLIFGDGAGSA